MSEAVRDIAKSTEEPEAAAKVDADELVSQMAEGEIDKLLAEAGAERPSSPPAVEAPAATAPTLQASTVGSAGDGAKVADGVDTSLAEVAVSEEPQTGLNTSAGGPPAPAKSGQTAEPVADLQTDCDPADLDDTEPLCQVPTYLRPLVWINLPTAGISDVLRQVMGVAAIVTLFNALATIIYVRFRHHH